MCCKKSNFGPREFDMIMIITYLFRVNALSVQESTFINNSCESSMKNENFIPPTSSSNSCPDKCTPLEKIITP